MPGGFGFVQQPQRPSPDPVKVGMALRQGAMQMAQHPSPGRFAQLTRQRPDATAVANPGPTEEAPFDPDQWTPPTQQPPHVQLALSRMAGRHSGGAGQSGTGSLPAGEPDTEIPDDGDEDDAHHSAVNAAVADALTRLGNGRITPPDALPSRASREQLARLGVSPFEVQLLNLTGGP